MNQYEHTTLGAWALPSVLKDSGTVSGALGQPHRQMHPPQLCTDQALSLLLRFYQTLTMC